MDRSPSASAPPPPHAPVFVKDEAPTPRALFATTPPLRHAPPPAVVASAGASQQMRAAVDARGAAAQQSAATKDSDSDDGVEEMIPPMPPPTSLVGRRVAWRVPTSRGSLGHEGSLAAVETSQPSPDAAQQRVLFRVRFEDGEHVLWAWRELHPWVRREAGDIAQQQQHSAPAPPPPAQPLAPPVPPAAAPAEGAAGGAPRVKQFKGVTGDRGSFRMHAREDGEVVTRTGFKTAEAAAQAFDDSRRSQGKRAMNFPRPNTNEVQAVPYEYETVTLRRLEPGVEHRRAQYAPRSKVAKPAKKERRSRATAAGVAPAAAPPPAAAAADLAPQLARAVGSNGDGDAGGDGCANCLQATMPVARKRSRNSAAPADDAAAAAAQPSPKRARAAAPAASIHDDNAEEDDADAALPLPEAFMPAPAATPAPDPPAASMHDDAGAPPEAVMQTPAHDAAHAAAPVAAPAAVPAAALAVAHAAAAAPSGGSADVAAFLRSINDPPLIHLDSILAAVPPDMSMAYLTLVAKQNIGEPVFARLRDGLFELLKVKCDLDQLAFTAALAELATRNA